MNVVLHVDSDAAYITMPEAKICNTVHFYLCEWPSPVPVKLSPKRNSPIHTKCKKIRNVVSSSSEAETCGTFNKGKICLPATRYYRIRAQTTSNSTQSENSTINIFANSGMKTKISNIWDMKLYWLRDKEVLELLRLYWDKNTNNGADYFMNNHPQTHFHPMQPRYIHTSNIVGNFSYRTITVNMH